MATPTTSSNRTARSVSMLIIGVVLVAGIGWALSSHFSAASPSEADKAEVDTSANEETAYCVATISVCFDEYDGWTVTKTTSEYPAKDSAAYGKGASALLEGATVKSPSGTLTLTFETGYTSLGGGGCNASTYNQQLIVQDVAPTRLSGVADSDYVNEQVVAIKAVLHRQNTGTYAPLLMVTQSKESSSIGTHDGCSWVWYDPLVKQKNAQVTSDSQLIFDRFSFTSFTPAIGSDTIGEAYGTQEEAQAVLDSDEFHRGFRLLQSLRYSD